MMLTRNTVLFLLLTLSLCSGQNHFMNAVRNLNDGKNETQDGDKSLKNDFTKYAKQCGSDEESAEYDDDFGDGGKVSKRGTYPNYYSDSKFKSNQQESLANPNRNYNRSNYSQNFENQNDDWRTKQSDNSNFNYGYRPIGNQYGNDRDTNLGYLNPMGNPNYDANNRPMRNYDRSPNDEFYGSISRQYGGTDGAYARSKRTVEANCVHQCAFGYLDLLDDNRVPSETAFIKYLQDHVPNDRKRIQFLREVRRCFAQLATTDNEDGCGFSKLLAKCLKLETE